MGTLLTGVCAVVPVRSFGCHPGTNFGRHNCSNIGRAAGLTFLASRTAHDSKKISVNCRKFGC